MLDVGLCLVVGVILGLAPAGWFATRPGVYEPLERPSSLPSMPSAEAVKLRSTPVLAAHGLLAESFPNGQGLDDSNKLRAVIDRQSAALGMAPYLPAIWAEIDDGGAKAEPDTYPYRFPGLDDLLETALPTHVLRSRATEVNDLAAMFIIAAGVQNRGDSRVQGRTGRVAFSLLNRLRDVGPVVAVRS